MNLHDWIDELCDALDLDAEVDEALLLDLARDVAHAVARPAAPVSAFLLGLAAGARGGDPALIEDLVERTRSLAERWDKPAASGDDGTEPDPVVDPEVDPAVDEALSEVEDLDRAGLVEHEADEEE